MIRAAFCLQYFEDYTLDTGIREVAAQSRSFILHIKPLTWILAMNNLPVITWRQCTEPPFDTKDAWNVMGLDSENCLFS